MKQIYLLIGLIVIFFTTVNAQVYNPVSYYLNGTPANGVKIKTNIPFQHGLGMPSIFIEGYSYGARNTIGLSISWYVYNGAFICQKMSSWGGYVPETKLAVEDGHIVIFLNSKIYFQRFNVRAYANGKSEQSSYFDGWTVVDEPLTGTNQTVVPYENRFAGNIYFPGGIWNSDGDMGIGTTSPSAKLTVKGDILATKVQIVSDDEIPASDYVFEPGYNLRSLSEVEQFIKTNKHLPEVPSATEFKENGYSVGEMDDILLRKVEELTLYIIELKKEKDAEIEALKQQIEHLNY